MKKTDNARLPRGLSSLAGCVVLAAAILLCPVGTCRAASTLKIGLLGEPKDLNPFQVSDSWKRKVMSFLYQPLYMIDPNTQMLIPWLAEDQPLYDPQSMTVTFHLRKMKWDDGSPFSAGDVVFTVRTIKRLQIPGYFTHWEYVKNIEAIDPRTVRLTLVKSMPVSAGRSLTTWIVQEKRWAPIVQELEEKAKDAHRPSDDAGGLDSDEVPSAAPGVLKAFQTPAIPAPIGLGPFRLKEWKKGAYILLEKNPYFFGQGKEIAGRRLGPFIDVVMMKFFDNLTTASLALKQGDIDFLWKGVSQALVEDLTRDASITVPMALDSGYRFLGFNLRKPPMSDHAFRHAVAYLIDKDFIVERILHKHGEKLDAFVPPNNPFYFDPNTPSYGRGMDRESRVKEAYRVLHEAGYRWETPPVSEDGSVRKGSGLSMPDGTVVPRITLLSPRADYDTELAACGQILSEWLQAFGLDVDWKTLSFGALLQQVRVERKFDMFLMGWRGLSLDPDYLRKFFQSSQDNLNGWNYTGYRNSEFDGMADRQKDALDRQDRRRIVIALQGVLARDLPILPLYVPHRMEGVRTDRFEGWGGAQGGVGNIWTFCLLKQRR